MDTQAKQREIKFRCWFADKMWYRIPAILFRKEYTQVNLNHKDDDFDQTADTWTGPDDYVLMQFTGLKDKNGKEIYEGDILNATDCELVGYHQNEYGESEIYEDSKGKVHYVGGGFCFDGHSAGDLPLDTFGPDALEVIGNIYENPELLATSNHTSL